MEIRNIGNHTKPYTEPYKTVYSFLCFLMIPCVYFFFTRELEKSCL